MPATTSAAVPGISVEQDGLQIELDQTELPQGERRSLSFRIAGADGSPITEFEVEHERELHLILVRRDLTGFQHLHPQMSEDGTWSTPVRFDQAGSYRVFADFNHDGESLTLGADLAVDGEADYEELPLQQTETETASGYSVGIEGEAPRAGQSSELAFNVARDGEPVQVEPYLGADGHLVALREGDLAFLHVHPAGGAGDEHGSDHAESDSHDEADGIRFLTEFPSAGRYRLYLQFKHEGKVHTAEFTREVAR